MGNRQPVNCADRFFALFSLAFALDAATRLALGLTDVSSEYEPFYIAGLVTFALTAILDKNRAGDRRR